MKKFIIILLLVFSGFIVLVAQPALPQRTLTVSATQPIHFGTFCVTGTGGGTVTVNWDGSRTATGSIVLLPVEPVSQPAVFDVKLCRGRLVTLSFDPATVITGTGGGSLTMNIGPTEKGNNGASFITTGDCNSVTIVRVGGTLNIPPNAIPGTYSGKFNLTFTQQ